MAPLAPLLAEEVWRGLTGGRSVHLTDWPAATEEVGERLVGEDGSYATAVRHVPEASLVADDALVAAMDEVRAVASAALGLRKANQLRVRQPLARLTVVVDDPAALAPYADLLARELNVKAVDLLPTDSDAADRFGITQRLAVNARAAGPRLGRGVQAVIKASKAGAWRVDDGGAVVVTTDDGDVALLPAEYELTTVVAPTAGGEDGPDVAAAVLAGGGFVVLDLALDDALRAEGYARDVVRDVQDARKAAGLEVSDRIALELDVPAEHLAAVEAHRELIARETLALDVAVAAGDGALTTCTCRGAVRSRKSSTREPSRCSACARTPAGAGCRSSAVVPGSMRATAEANRVRDIERATSSAPGTRLRPASRHRPGHDSESATSRRETSRRRYPSRARASTAFGPACTPPVTPRVRCTPRKPACGSGTG